MGDGVINFPAKIKRPTHLEKVEPMTLEEEEQRVRDLNRNVLRHHMRAMVGIFGGLEEMRREVLAALSETERDGRGI